MTFSKFILKGIILSDYVGLLQTVDLKFIYAELFLNFYVTFKGIKANDVVFCPWPGKVGLSNPLLNAYRYKYPFLNRILTAEMLPLATLSVIG
jgi:hypothetical protein